MIGETIGNYRVISKLGEGGMGAVYLAEHFVIGRRVAVKVLRPEGATNPELLHRFFLEARSTASLRHPALVDVLDYGYAANERPYIIMEFVEGESLATRIQRSGTLTIGSTIEIARQIAVGMGVAHTAGLVHRDLKPGNILLTAAERGRGGDVVKILDFGIAKLMSPDPLTGPLTQASAFMGTPMYMAPEQCLGAANVDHRADIYALGCMVYEMACGCPPFAPTSMRELIAGHLRGSPVPPRARRSEIPAQLEAVILTALAKKPASRQANMTDLAEELERCAKELDPSVPYGGGRSSIEGASGSSIFPVSKPARDSRASLPNAARPRPALKSSRHGWAALAVSTIALGALATVWMQHRAPLEKPEPETAPSLATIAAPPAVERAPTATAPSIGGAAGMSPAPEIAVPSAAGMPPLETVRISSPTPVPAVKPPASKGSRAPVRAVPADAGAAPAPAVSKSEPDSPPAFGGDDVQNPWPN